MLLRSALTIFFMATITIPYTKTQESLFIETLYGNCIINEPVLVDLIQAPSMQRLKHIAQYGISPYVKKMPSYSRFDHSIGVMYLIRKYGGSLLEQVAGLLHDVSHTVFSHVTDRLFNVEDGESSYQDSIHTWFIKNTEIESILERHGIKAEDIDPQNGNFIMLERSLPYMCADRLEYNLRGGLIAGILTQEEITFILDELTFENNYWCFKNREAAKKIGYNSLFLTEHVFGSAWNCYVYKHACTILQRCLDLQLITIDEIHFGTDQAVFEKIKKSRDPLIMELLYKIENTDEAFTIAHDNLGDNICLQKFRGIDPLVITQNKQQVVLTLLDPHFAKQFKHLKEKIKKGWAIIEQI